MQGGQWPGEKKKSGKLDHFWKDLVENPDNWWDNRAQKRNPKAPDFKNKETGEVLWLSSSPGWALSRLPPMKDG
ncbi:UNVERIFIED_CONTAM: protein OSB3, chloroplastic/mitochondrial [Sesamum radiatum]|uniref:Protein OSB3, chloroplastic/mitochondrial n=1 Tax=Sesamum radiatum TaxID=300843 RepID=A0AAW2R4T5_SESRA